MVYISTVWGNNGSVRICDIIVVDKIKSKGVILDPIVSFEMSSAQSEYINKEKIKISNQQFYIIKHRVLVYLLDLVKNSKIFLWLFTSL